MFLRPPRWARTRDTVAAGGCLSIIALLYVMPVAVQIALLMALVALGAFSPRGILLAVPATIGFIYKPIGFDGLHFNPVEVLVTAGAIAISVNIATTVASNRHRGVERAKMWTSNLVEDRFAATLAVGLLVIGSISLLIVADPTYARESVRQFRWVIAVPIVYFLSVAALFRDRPGRLLLAGTFVAGGALAAVVALGGAAVGGGITADSATRATGLAPHPNALALYLERVVSFGLVLALVSRSRVSTGWGILATIALAALVLTLSRGALLAVSITCIVIFMLAGSRRLAAVAAGVSLVAGLTILVFAPDRLLRLFEGGSGSLRLELWRSSLSMIRDHWVSGVGLDQFLYQYLPRYVSAAAWPERFTSHPHQVVLDVWLNLGIMGLLFAAAYCLFAVRRIWGALGSADGLRLAAASGLIVGLVHGLVDNSYFLPDLAIMFWLFTALLTDDRRPGECALSASS